MIITANYHGHEISLDPSIHYFSVEGPLMKDKFRSYDEATEAVDSALKATEKQKRTEASLSLAMLDDVGNPVTIKGIHASTKKLLGAGDTTMVYPVVDWVREALMSRETLWRRLKALDRALDATACAVSRGYGRIAPEKYDGLISDFTAEAAEKAARAVEMTPKKDAAT